MKDIIEVEIFKLTDYEMINDTSHTSISGGVATHNFEFIEKFEAKNLKAVKVKLKERGLKVYEVEGDKLWATMKGEEANVSYEVYIKKLLSQKISASDLKTLKDKPMGRPKKLKDAIISIRVNSDEKKFLDDHKIKPYELIKKAIANEKSKITKKNKRTN